MQSMFVAKIQIKPNFFLIFVILILLKSKTYFPFVITYGIIFYFKCSHTYCPLSKHFFAISKSFYSVHKYIYCCKLFVTIKAEIRQKNNYLFASRTVIITDLCANARWYFQSLESGTFARVIFITWMRIRGGFFFEIIKGGKESVLFPRDAGLISVHF